MDQPEEPKKKRVRVVDLREQMTITINNSDEQHLLKLQAAIEALSRLNTTISPKLISTAPTVEELDADIARIDKEVKAALHAETVERWNRMKRGAKNALYKNNKPLPGQRP